MIENLIGNWRKSGWISAPGIVYYLSHCYSLKDLNFFLKLPHYQIRQTIAQPTRWWVDLGEGSFRSSVSFKKFHIRFFFLFFLGTADKRYQTKRHEHVANIATFLIGVLYAFYMLKFALFDTYYDSRFILIFVYAFTFLGMVTFSTLFHFIDFFKWKSLMKYFKVKILYHSIEKLRNFRFCTFLTAVVYIYLFVAVTRPGCSLRIFLILR